MSVAKSNVESARAGRRRPQFRLAWLLAPPLALVVILMVIDRHTNWFRRDWTGRREVAFSFELIRTDDGRPIEGAAVEILDAGGKSRISGRTGADGRATLQEWFAVSWATSMFAKPHDGSVERVLVSLSAQGFAPLKVHWNAGSSESPDRINVMQVPLDRLTTQP